MNPQRAILLQCLVDHGHWESVGVFASNALAWSWARDQDQTFRTVYQDNGDIISRSGRPADRPEDRSQLFSIVEWVEFDKNDLSSWPEKDGAKDSVEVLSSDGDIVSMHYPGRKFTDTYGNRVEVTHWCALPRFEAALLLKT